MANLAVKFLSAVSAGIVASAPIAMIPLSAAGAVEECLTKPKDEASPGKHWYYRIERGSKRHCWYLRAEGQTSSRAATSTPARRAAPEVAPDRETKLPRSAADAHAELPLPQTLVEADPRISPTTPATSPDPRGVEEKLSNNASPETAQSLVASRWPEPTGVFSSATELPISPSFEVASTAPDTRLDASVSTDLTPKVAPVAPTEVKTSATGTPASLQMLLLATFGVIAVSWGGAIYLIARLRRPQRYSRLSPPDWPTEEPTDHPGLPPWLEPMTVNSNRRLDPGRDAGGQSLDRQSNRLGDNASEVEQLLARFANQAQAGP
jgi:hypothetical protein